MRALRVGVAIVLVFIQREVPICPRIDAHFQRVLCLLRRPLHRRPHRHNRSSAHIQRQLRQRRVRLNPLPTLHAIASPKVIPNRLRQIHRPRRRALRRHRTHQQRRPKQILIARVLRLHILAPVHHQRPHQRPMPARHLPRFRINVRHQSVSQRVVVHQDFLGLRPIRPQLVLIRPPRSMHPKYR